MESTLSEYTLTLKFKFPPKKFEEILGKIWVVNYNFCWTFLFKSQVILSNPNSGLLFQKYVTFYRTTPVLFSFKTDIKKTPGTEKHQEVAVSLNILDSRA